jgi:hypothetical protein
MKTYLFFSKYFNEHLVDNIFSTNPNWKKANKNDRYIDFIYFDNYIKFKEFKISDIKTEIKYEYYDLNKDKIKLTNKSLLYENFLEFNKEFTFKYFMPQFNLSKIKMDELKTVFNHKNLWILKPTFGYRGSGIKIFNNYDIFKKYYTTIAIPELKSFLTKHKKNKYENWILAKYIENPFLFNNRKFHLRVYLLTTNFNNNLEGYLFHIIPIIIAKKDYIKNNYDNKNIHNTHWTDDRKNLYLFPTDFYENFGLEKTKYIYNEITNICKTIFDFIKKKITLTCYSETKNCFEILGIDIMITENMELKILEINENVSFQVLADFSLLSYLFIQSIIDITINKYYDEKYKIKLQKNILTQL